MTQRIDPVGPRRDLAGVAPARILTPLEREQERQRRERERRRRKRAPQPPRDGGLDVRA